MKSSELSQEIAIPGVSAAERQKQIHAISKSPIAANHISRTRPDLVHSYGKYLTDTVPK